MEVVMNKENWK